MFSLNNRVMSNNMSHEWYDEIPLKESTLYALSVVSQQFSIAVEPRLLN